MFIDSLDLNAYLQFFLIKIRLYWAISKFMISLYKNKKNLES